MDSVVSCALIASNGIGSIVDGRFPLLRWLGGTESSSVFLTELDGDPPRKAAIKLIPAAGIDADLRLAQWVTAKNLSHPHLIHVFHAGRCEVDGEDCLYIVTEYADEVLSEILTARALTPAETAEMLGPVLDALSWLHDHDRVHGHLQPSNIMVVDDRLKLSVDGLHSDGEFGRPALSSNKYDAPEIATGLISPATDVWSLGVLLVQALSQHPPAWNGPRTGEPVVPATLREPWSGLARRCLLVDPARRCTLNDVRASVQSSQAPAQVVKPVRSTTPTLPHRTRTMILVGAAVVLGGAITALIVSSRHSQSQPSPPAVTQASAPEPAATQPQSAPEPSPQEPPAPQAAAPQAAVPQPTPAQPSGAKGAVVFRTTPDVPQHILDTIQGHIRVRIRIDVDPEGKVSNAAIDDPGPSRYFAAKALATARDWKFAPQQADGRAVASAWMLHFQFGRTDTTITPVEIAP